MHIHFRIRTRVMTAAGPRVRMDCPSCHARQTVAASADVTSKELLWGVIPLTTTRWATITCGSCNRAFRSNVRCKDLVSLTPNQVTRIVTDYGLAYVGNITKVCIFFSVLCGIVPLFGLGCAIAGIIGSRKAISGWRTAAFVGLTLSIVSTLLCIAGLLFTKST